MGMASRRLGLESSNLLQRIENPWSFIIDYIQKFGYCYVYYFFYVSPQGSKKNMLWAWSQLHQNQSAFLNDGDFLRLILSTKQKGHSLTSEFLTGIIMVSINTPNLDFEWFFLQGSGYYLYMIDVDENNTWHDWGYFAIPET